MLDSSEKALLLKLARSVLSACLNDEPAPSFAITSERVLERKGAFVSLHSGEELRGCIGQLYPDQELYRTVQQCAVSAALEDVRFFPVSKEELSGLTIEISVLTPFRRIRNVEEIEVGRHGLFIVRGSSRGLLLPQVATEYGWDREKFLSQACRKSGLAESAWREPDTLIHVFEAQVFSEQRE